MLETTVPELLSSLELEELDRDSFAKMNAMGDYVRTSLRAAVADLPVQVDGEGSLFKISASDTKIVDYRSSLKANGAWEDTMSLALLTRGFWLTPRLHGCVSTVTTSEEIDDFVDTFKDIIRV